MKQTIESLVNPITMYRLVLYCLIAIASMAIALAWLGLISLPIIGLLASLVVLLVVSFGATRLVNWTFSAQSNSESWIITALILFLIVPPITSPATFFGAIFVGLVAIVSKYVLAYRGRHIFNPAAIALAIGGVTGLMPALWWVATPFLLPVVAMAGLLVTAKTRRYDLVGIFLVTALAVTLGIAFGNAYDISESLSVLVLSGPLVFFATIMLTEPLTSPTTRLWRYAYATIVGVLFASQLPIVAIPAVALVIGNIIAFLANRKGAIALTVESVDEIGPHIYGISTKPLSKLVFRPGQYLELSIPHEHEDHKGMRRTFSIASAPSDDQVQFGVSIGKEISSFKAELIKSQGETIRATLLGGDFTLPKNPETPLVFVAGGIGITPFRSMIADLIARNEKRDIVLFYGAANIDAVVYGDILDQAEKSIGLRIIPVLERAEEDEWSGDTGFITGSLIKKQVRDLDERLVYISGPPVMVDSVKQQLRSLGISGNHIKTDHFSGY